MIMLIQTCRPATKPNSSQNAEATSRNWRVVIGVVCLLVDSGVAVLGLALEPLAIKRAVQRHGWKAKALPAARAVATAVAVVFRALLRSRLVAPQAK